MKQVFISHINTWEEAPDEKDGASKVICQVGVTYDTDETITMTLPDNTKESQDVGRVRNWVFESKLGDEQEWRVVMI